VGYCRVSSERQAESGLGLDSQDTQFLEYFERMLKPRGVELGPMFVDPAVSASKRMFLDRPEAARMQAALRGGDHVVIAKLDRAFRNALDYASTLQRWLEAGVHVHILNFGMDTSNPTGLMVAKMVGGMLAYFAEFESHMIGQRKRDANAIARRQGRPTNHRVKPGWKIAGPPGKRRIVPDEDERATMRKIVEWHDAGLTFSDISKVLTKQRVFWKKPSKTGFTPEFWDRQRCRRAYLEMKRIMAGAA
jgi:DNA invertase Pin-like site-specific DNA recombinase